ncbi:uncharacterized protein LOC115364696 isoform X2 [Myripristis murdjan]|uniref:uncharacterized protein LOC115364696 isoform X2 n=1 Tax=Myripristis murdjan TaxID=586833 RepID=UPI001175EBD0|nr:uncharacterized protein LOC115364696 isoform X2 [Myripristis murdjan]
MGKRLLSLCVLVALLYQETSGFMIRNKLLGKCLQVQDGHSGGGRVSLGECSPHLSIQEWRWLPESHALSSLHTGECLTAPAEQYEGVRLQPCILRADNVETGPGEGEMETDREAGSQAWTCSKKGHLTLFGKGLHLSARQESTLVFLSKEHKQGSRWRTLDNQTLCSERDSNHHQHQYHPHRHLGESAQPSAISSTHRQAQLFEGGEGFEATGTVPVTELSPLSLSTKSPAEPTMIFFSMDYGMGWKITMLVLSSLALVLGTVILILNVYSNRRKKVVCVLKSYTPRQEASVPGSPVPNERAPLTKHAMRLSHSSPTVQRGEILIEWKDGTVTPLYEG